MASKSVSKSASTVVAKPFDPKSVIKKVTTDVIEWNKVPNGTWMSFTIGTGLKAKTNIGKILRENGYVYLLQNMFGGSTPSTRYQFKYAYAVGTAIQFNRCLAEDSLPMNVKNFRLISGPPKGYVQQKFYKCGSYDVLFNPGGIKVGCTFVSNETVLEIAAALKPAPKAKVPAKKF